MLPVKSQDSLCVINAANTPFLARIWTVTILLTKPDLESCPVRVHNQVIYVSTLLGKLKANISDL